MKVHRVEQLFLATVAFYALALTGAHATTVTEQLALAGHPNVKLCPSSETRMGLGKILVVQFTNRGSHTENRNESVEILKLIVDALNGTRQIFVGFKATDSWSSCDSEEPDHVFWRDYDDSWRYVNNRPEVFLRKKEEDLPTNLRSTPAEAYVLFSIGLVQQRSNRISKSIGQFEKAYELLKDTDDPNRIKAYVLAPLIQHYFGKGKDEERGQTYLTDYAMAVKQSPVDKAEYVPLIKVAPEYPPRAQRSGREGYVILEFIVDADGKVQDPVVFEESPVGFHFGAAAIKAAKSFRYIPAVVDGVRVPTPGVRNRITFELY